MFDPSHPSNAQAVACLKSADHCSPEQADDPYLELGTHPDLVGWLWSNWSGHLPVDCRWVVGRQPALARPDTGVAFGFAMGTHDISMRLDEADWNALRTIQWEVVERRAQESLLVGKEKADYVDGQLRDSHVGLDWIIGIFLNEEEAFCLKAYEWAV